MNLIWHIFLKDVRRLQWSILFFIVLLVLPMLTAVLPYPPDGLMEGRGAIVSSVLEVLIISAVSYFLVMSIVGEDTLTNGNEFWRVRPISGLRLFAAKVLLVAALLLVLPLMVSLPWWLGHGYGLGEIGAATKSMLMARVPLVGIALVVAALSGTSGKFVGYSFVLGLGIPAFAAFVAKNPFNLQAISKDMIETRGWVLFSIFCLTMGGVLLNQFLTRRIGRSWLMLGLAAVSMVASSLYWPWEFYSYFKAKSEAEPMASLVVSVTSGKQSRPMSLVEFPLRVAYQVSGLPEPYLVTLRSVTHKIAWPDRKIAGDKKTNLYEGGLTLSERGCIQLLATEKGDSREPQTLTAQLVMPDAKTMERAIHEPAAYHAEISGKAWKPEIVSELPCHGGATSNQRGFGVEIQSVQLLSGARIQVELRQHTPEFLTKDLPLVGARSRVLPTETKLSYAIINRQRGGLLVAAQSDPEHVFSTATVRRFEQQLVFSPRTPAEAPTGDLAAWLKDAVLVTIFVREEEFFKRILETPRLIVTGLPPKQPSK